MDRWHGRERFVMLATGFGTGTDFLRTWQRWRCDPMRGRRLVYIAVEPHPPQRADIAAPDDATAPLAERLRVAWPPLTRNLHRLAFEDHAVELLLAVGEWRDWARELVAGIDAFELAAPLPAPDLHGAKALGRLAAPGATLVAAGPARDWRAPLAAAGFVVDDATPDDTGITRARFAPAFTPRRAAARTPSRSGEPERHALIVGAGLGGCAAAWALSAQGWRSTLLDRRAEPASEASGNPAGLFHGIVNAQDGAHARFNRAAALAARGAVQAALDAGVAGSAQGLLRLESALDVTQMRALLQRLALPPDYVQALAADEASALAGLPLSQSAWFYPGGGWVDPAGLARHFVAGAGDHVTWRPHADVQRLETTPSGWRLCDAQGATLAEASTVVLSNAIDAVRLLGADWPLVAVRGQISIADAAQLPTPQLPIAGHGYLLPAHRGAAMFGATAQPGDPDPAVRAADHARNLAQLARLTGADTGLAPEALHGRTAWRCSAVDKLPLLGAVPQDADVEHGASGTRLVRPRDVPRRPGLYVYTALGSRGITWSALGAQVLASWVTGAPAPVEASLLDALDPARFVSRRTRRRPATPRSRRAPAGG